MFGSRIGVGGWKVSVDCGEGEDELAPHQRHHAEESICCLYAAEYISPDDSSGYRNF